MAKVKLTGSELNGDEMVKSISLSSGKNNDRTAKPESETDLTENQLVFSKHWKVVLHRGKNSKYPDGTFVVELISLRGWKVSKCYVLHELEKNNGKFNEVLTTLEVFGTGINRAILEQMIKYATELRDTVDANELSSNEFASKLAAALGEEDGSEAFKTFQENFKDDLKRYPTFTSQQYNSKQDFGIIFDTPTLQKKYSGALVAVNKYTLMELFVWDDGAATSRDNYSPSKTPEGHLNAILNSWRELGILVPGSDGRLNNIVRDVSETSNRDRFYILRMPELLAEVLELKAGEVNV